MSREEKAKQVRRALKKLADSNPGLSINELRVVLALERAVARLSTHKLLATHLIFKGGFVLLKAMKSIRFTRDLDALAYGIPASAVSALVIEALSADLDDGFWFGGIATEDISGEADYSGIRFSFAFSIGEPPIQPQKLKKLSRVHVDIAFGDSVLNPKANELMTSLLSSFEPVTWHIYPIEQIFAEKLQTLMDRGSANSRGKDIYDLVLLFPRCSDAVALVATIKSTFSVRQTPIPNSFQDSVAALNTTILKAGWNSLLLMRAEANFEECWQQLLVILQQLDSYLSK